MIAERDGRCLYEAHHDITAALDPSLITAVLVLQAAVVHTRDRLSQAQQGLETATRFFAQENAETAQARHQLAQTAAKADGIWRFVRGRLAGDLIAPDPEEPQPPAAELIRREAVVEQVLPYNPTFFARLSVDRKIRVLQDTIAAAAIEPNRVVLGPVAAAITQRFPAILALLIQHNDDLLRELREDREAYRKLEEARAEYDERHSAHLSQIEAALKDGGRLADLGRYIRARDAAYRARRSSRPLKEEPGIEAITTALGVTPDAIEAPVAES